MNRLTFSAFLLAAVVASVLKAAPAADPSSPEAERAAMHVLEGYDVSLFASEADGVAKPIQMRFDERGRLWVACSTSYPQIEPGQKPSDRVVILEDADGDGRVDKSTVFADGLLMPTGIEIAGDGAAYVANSSELLLLRDTDGDDKADQREVLFSGFGTGDGHQMINSFQWGPGGEFWFSQGAHTFSNVETPWGVERLYSAGVWRFRPRTMRLEPMLDSRRGHPTNSWAGPANPWGFTFDEWGQPFLNDAAGLRGLSWMVPGMIRSDRHVPIPTLWNVPKGCGIDIVGTTAMPDDMQGNLVLGHYFTASVRQFRIADEASGFALTELPPLITCDQNAFRIVDVKVGPDGAIYLCDWYNPVIGHYQASYRDPARDRTHGRIWRLTAKNRPATKRPALADMTPAELLEQLRSPDRWTTYQARRLLFIGDTETVVPAADAWVATLDPNHTQYEHLLYSAIGVFEAHEVVRPELLNKLITAKDFRARAYAARVVGHWHDRLKAPLDLLRMLVQDAHPRVRVEAIVSTTLVPDPRAIEVAAMAADRSIDVWVEHAMLRAVDAAKDLWRPAFLEGELTFDNRVDRLSWVLQSDGSPEMAGHVRTMLDAPRLDAKAKSDMAALLANIGTVDDMRLLLERFASDARVLGEMATASRVRNLKPTADAPAAAALTSQLLTLIQDDGADPAVRAAAIRLAGAWSIQPAAGALRTVATSAEVLAPVRAAAVDALGELGAISASDLAPLLAADQPAAVRIAAVGAAAVAGDDLPAAAVAAAPLLAEVNDPEQIGQLLAVFVSRDDGAAALAKALESTKLAPEAAKRSLDVLHARGQGDAGLVAVLNRAMGVSDATPPFSEDYVRDLAAEAAQRGDPKRGREIYNVKLASCAACHAIDGAGGALGPDLTAIGRGLTSEFIIESVLWPGRQVKEGFLSVTVATKKRQVFSGYAVSEDAAEIRLRDVASNTVKRIPKDAIAKRVNAGTIMPDGLVASLSREELCDLISFLANLGKEPAR